MERFVLIARARFGEKHIPVGEVLGRERALAEAHRIYRDGTMNRVAVINEEFKTEFTIQRRCNCTNVNQEILVVDGVTQVVLRCITCALVINHEGYLTKEREVVTV